MRAQAQPIPADSIDAATEGGLVSLTVADLDRSTSFYTKALGLEALLTGGSTATLGVAGTPLLLLTEHRGARPWPHDRYGYTGLYHFAILVPTRADLGRWLRHWLGSGYPMPGQGDHLVSEALYLSDPDGNGIEVYRDRPRDKWTWVDGQVRMAADLVDIEGLLAEADHEGSAWTGMAAGTKVGHIHLQVGEIEQAAAIYHGVLGFDIVAHMPTALFVSAGGYYHHIGMNVWHSRGASPAPEGTAGLRFLTLQLPSEEARAAVVARAEAAGVAATPRDDTVEIDDPWRNKILLRGSASPDARAA